MPKTVLKKVTPLRDYITSALGEALEFLKTFQSFSPGNKKEYLEWITEVKTEETWKNDFRQQSDDVERENTEPEVCR